MAKKQSLKQKRKIRSARPRQQLPLRFDSSSTRAMQYRAYLQFKALDDVEFPEDCTEDDIRDMKAVTGLILREIVKSGSTPMLSFSQMSRALGYRMCWERCREITIRLVELGLISSTDFA